MFRPLSRFQESCHGSCCIHRLGYSIVCSHSQMTSESKTNGYPYLNTSPCRFCAISPERWTLLPLASPGVPSRTTHAPTSRHVPQGYNRPSGRWYGTLCTHGCLGSRLVPTFMCATGTYLGNHATELLTQWTVTPLIAVWTRKVPPQIRKVFRWLHAACYSG